MIRPPHSDGGLSGPALIMVLVLLIGAIAVLVTTFPLMGGPDTSRTFPGGVVAESMYVSGDSIQPVGSVTGFSSAYRGQTPVPVVYRHTDPDTMGSVQLTISLFIGDTGAIDTDKLNVTWKSRQSDEQIRKSRDTTLICPNWTIAGKYHVLPGRIADPDEWLEPGEQFLIIACPAAGLGPYQTFTMSMYPDGVAAPLRFTRTVPPRITPVMDLG